MGSRVKATRGIAHELQVAHEAVSILDAVISRNFATNPSFLAEWTHARRVPAKPGVARSAGASEIVDITPAPAIVGVAA